MRSRPSPAIALCVSASILLQAAGCSASDPCIKQKVKGDGPNEYYFTYDSIQCIGRGKEVMLNLKDSSVVRGKFWGIDVKPLAVYVVLPEHLPQVIDTLRDWVPIASEQIIVYNYPSHSVVFEGVADDDVWKGMMKAAKQKLHYMTPRLVSKHPVAAKISQGSVKLKVPVDSISQVVRRETVSSDRTLAEHIAIGTAFFAGAVAAAYVITLLLWPNAGVKIM